MEALYRLNEVDKSIMLLYLEDYSYEEISDIVGISASNVGVKIHRLKVQLQKQLNN
ncbi:RNA polymerase ECF-type sigma factor [Bacteroides reticulotermitis JCM 10512]|uniref:RNA polymerase ECF-type sigma factor n=1 Tax=Bacteroides reticulotermitis JCM 10512 TaxID=1445607 RepID=W4UVD9_9BACE|nr:RNA polymerase ECF-type sigma factor [Bacteroides reticulotermitis JCM 10512]